MRKKFKPSRNPKEPKDLSPKTQSQIEIDTLDELEYLDSLKFVYEILDNPEVFFEPYLTKLKNPISILHGKFIIFVHIKTIDGYSPKRPSEYKNLIEKYGPLKMGEVFNRFYNYVIDIVEYILENHDNVMLDLYNDGRLSKERMTQTIMLFKETQKVLLSDKEELYKILDEIEETNKMIKEKYDEGYDNFR